MSAIRPCLPAGPTANQAALSLLVTSLLAASCGGLVEDEGRGSTSVGAGAGSISSGVGGGSAESDDLPKAGLLADFDRNHTWRDGCPEPRWVHQHYLNIEGSVASMSDGVDVKVRISCEAGDDPHCNTPLATGQEKQWAALSVYLGDTDTDPSKCFDLSMFRGIQFDMTPAGDDDAFHVELANQATQPATNDAAQSKVFIFLDSDIHRVAVDFAELVTPAGQEPLDLTSVQRISFVVRQRLFDEETGTEIVTPYEQLYDNVLFYNGEQ
jgi:hypothetical protein